MKSVKNPILKGLMTLGLVLGSISAKAQTAPTPTITSSQTYINYWRVSAKKNFFEGFCVGQKLAVQNIVLQPGQQLDQATINAFKTAIATCKGRSNQPTTNPGNGPVTPPVTPPVTTTSPSLPTTSPPPPNPLG